MATTILYLVRHGKTMFNTLGRAQGWCDSPLTAIGRQGIAELGQGFKAAGLVFDQAVTSDSGRTIETLRLILQEQGQTDLPHQVDPKLREWCFGSLEGLYDDELFRGVLPRAVTDASHQSLEQMTYPELAERLYAVDTAGWAEPWEMLRERLLAGLTAVARQQDEAGGGRVLVVSHGMSIATLVWLLDPSREKAMLDNGSVTQMTYRDGQFTIDSVGEMSYRQLGREVLDGSE